MRFYNEAESVCDFMIMVASNLVFVRVKRATRVHCTVQEMETELRAQIIRLSAITGSGTVTRELWAYTKSGAWRYFRLRDAGLTEISRDGNPLTVPEKEPTATNGVVAAGETEMAPAQS
jgi:hypothetical protein